MSGTGRPSRSASAIASGKTSASVVMDLAGEGETFRYSGTVSFEPPGKAEALTIRSLTKGNPEMQQLFTDAGIDVN